MGSSDAFIWAHLREAYLAIHKVVGVVSMSFLKQSLAALRDSMETFPICHKLQSREGKSWVVFGDDSVIFYDGDSKILQLEENNQPLTFPTESFDPIFWSYSREQ